MIVSVMGALKDARLPDTASACELAQRRYVGEQSELAMITSGARAQTRRYHRNFIFGHWEKRQALRPAL